MGSVSLNGSWSAIGAGGIDIDDLARADRGGRGEEGVEVGEKIRDAVGSNADNDEAHPVFLQPVLHFQPAVDRNKDVKRLFRERQKAFVLYAAPTGLGNGLYRVAWKGSAETSRNALV